MCSNMFYLRILDKFNCPQDSTEKSVKCDAGERFSS